MKNNCLLCKGDLVTIQGEINGVKTRYCKECGFVQQFFTAELRNRLTPGIVAADENVEIPEGNK